MLYMLYVHTDELSQCKKDGRVIMHKDINRQIRRYRNMQRHRHRKRWKSRRNRT